MEELSAQVGNQWTDSRPSAVSLYQHSRVPAPKPKPALPTQGNKRLIYSGLPISTGGEKVTSQSLSPERVTTNQIPL